MPEFYADMAGEYIFSLAVHDGLDWSPPALLPVTLTEKINNSIPAVNAGNSMTVDAGDAECSPSGYSYSCSSCDDVSITLGQGASVNDPNGDAYTLEWSVLGGRCIYLRYNFSEHNRYISQRRSRRTRHVCEQ